MHITYFDHFYLSLSTLIPHPPLVFHFPTTFMFFFSDFTYERKHEILIFLFSFFFPFIHMCIHCLGHFSTMPPSSPLSPSPALFQAGPLLPLSLILLKKRHKHNKGDKAFLIAELRIAIQRDPYHCFCVPMCYDPC
jgi:hypothetical protein